MSRPIIEGSTNNIIRLMLPVSNLTFASELLWVNVIAGTQTFSYLSDDDEIEQIATIGIYQAPAVGKCRFRPVDFSLFPKLYEIQLSDAVFAQGGYGIDLMVLAPDIEPPIEPTHYQITLTNQLVVAPIVGSSPVRNNEVAITTYSGENYIATVSGVDSTGAVIDWTALGALVFVVDGDGTTDKFSIADSSITKTSTYFQLVIPSSVNVADNVYDWSIRRVSTNTVMLKGKLRVRYAADKDEA